MITHSASLPSKFAQTVPSPAIVLSFFSPWRCFKCEHHSQWYPRKTADNLCLFHMTTFLLVLKTCTLFQPAHAAPTQDLTALRDTIVPPWMPDPNGRGTWSLLYSCAFTTVFCVWTAIHLNMPAHGETKKQHFLRKMKWVLLAIVAPQPGVGNLAILLP